MTIDRFEDLKCWQKARGLVNALYRAIQADTRYQKDFPLVDQSTRASISVMNNIAEGWASQSNREFIRFLTYSRRSAAEVQNCLYIAKDQGYLVDKTFTELYQQALETIKIIDGLLRYLRSRK